MERSFYEQKLYPTVFDYQERANADGLAIIDEIYYESHFLSNAMLKPTNDGMRERFKRETEKVSSGHAASLDEGYWGEKNTAPLEEKSFETMRWSDQLKWEHTQQIGADDGGVTLKAKQMKEATDSMLDGKVHCMLYGNSLNATVAGKDKGAKVINGLFTHLDKPFSKSEYEQMLDYYDERVLPFKDTGERCLTFSNFSDTRKDASDAYKAHGASEKFTSIIGVAFGEQGVVTVYPDVVGSFLGHSMDYKANIEATVMRGGKEVSYEYDRCNFDAYFGIGVKNRYCLAGLRNIYLGHDKKDAIFEEMAMVEENLIKLKDFFDLGHTGYTMQFYAHPRLITQMEMYQKEKYPAYNSVGSRDFNGINPRRRPSEISITHDITLLSDRVIKGNEKFVPVA